MKHEVFILGGQRIDQKRSEEQEAEEQEGMVERLGEMRKWRRERIEKGRKEEREQGAERG